MLLNEVFDRPSEWKWTKQDSSEHFAEFNVDDLTYEVAFEYSGFRKAWVHEFAIIKDGEREMGITGSGNSQTVISTWLTILFDFNKRVQPNIIRFTAEEPSRIKLYDRLAKVKFSKVWNVERENAPNGDVVWLLNKK